MRLLAIHCIYFLLFACNVDNNGNSSNDVASSWEEAKLEYSQQNYKDSLIRLNNIINDYPDSDIVPECLYLIHEIYLNEFDNHYISIQYLENIINSYPEDDFAKKALFTLAYIYNNHLESYTDAYNTYSQFIEKYPEDDLVDAAIYEIDNLSVHIKSIDDILKEK